MFEIVRDEVERSGWLHPHLAKLKLPFHSPFSIKSKITEPPKRTVPHPFSSSIVLSFVQTLKDDPPGLALPGTELLYFDKPISERLKARFLDIKVLYSQTLLDSITKKMNDPGDISMKLRYLGLDSDNTELYIVIQCEKKIARRIRRFFAQPHVEEELLPDFRVLVLNNTLLRLSNDGITQVFSKSIPEKTICGMPIELHRGDRSVDCTLGGVMMVETCQKRLYGLMAGHALRTLRASSPMTEDSGYSSGDEYPGADGDSRSKSDTSSKPLGSDTEKQDHDPGRLRLNISTIVHDTFSTPGRNNYDWALVELGQEYALPNIVTPNLQAQTTDPVDSRAEIQCYDPSSLETSLTKQVLLLRQGQPLKAELSFSTSSLMISPGSGFVDAYDVIMKDGSSLSPGDSGLWVIDKKTSRLYGHVVSVDAFGEAQVMPIHCTLQSIRKQLKAIRVSLPLSWEVEQLASSSCSIQDPDAETIILGRAQPAFLGTGFLPLPFLLASSLTSSLTSSLFAIPLLTRPLLLQFFHLQGESLTHILRRLLEGSSSGVQPNPSPTAPERGASVRIAIASVYKRQ